MKIAVTSQGVHMASLVEPRFGRAQQFIVYDTEEKSFQVISNEGSLDAAQGAGVHTAEMLAGMNVDCLISGHCGPNAFRTLSAAGITVYTGADGTVAEMIDAVQDGKLEASGSPDKASHWV
jgi:predicted Fe-Mo cluster-binding NifX family protein